MLLIGDCKVSPFVLALASFLLGCGRLGYQSTRDASLAEDTSMNDGEVVGDASMDAGDTMDADTDSGERDGGDAGGVTDSGLARVPGCGEATDPGTLALYRMEDMPLTQLTDAVGLHPGTFVGGTPIAVTGPPGCGQAMSISSALHGFIPDSPDWQISQGSIDFWILSPPASTGTVGFISRDAASRPAQPGRISIFRISRVEVRIDWTVGSVLQCSAVALPDNEWTHVGVNFGPPAVEIYVNGVKGTFTGTGCGTVGDYSINGNNNPWIIGGLTPNADPGTGTPVANRFLGGYIDEVRISSVRRDFAATMSRL